MVQSRPRHQTLPSAFKNAFSGIWRVSHERNFRIEFCIGLIAWFSAFFFNITLSQKLIVFLISGMVLSAELINSVIEIVCDRIDPNFDPAIGHAKDIMAGAVLILAITSVFIGLFIFVPYWLKFLAIG